MKDLLLPNTVNQKDEKLYTTGLDDTAILHINIKLPTQARNQDFMWGGANEAKVDQTTEMYFLLSDPFI